MMTSTANAEKLAAATRAAPRVASVAPIVAQTRRTVADTADATEVMCQVVRRNRRVVACPPNLVEGSVCGSTPGNIILSPPMACKAAADHPKIPAISHIAFKLHLQHSRRRAEV
jgi:hypothetical protein